MLSDKEAMEVYCHFNSIKVRLEHAIQAVGALII